MNLPALRDTYLPLLRDGLIPFWTEHGIDHEYGGVLSCMTEDGTPINSDKYIWSQGRFVWTLSALYNRFERRSAFLDHARKTIDFLLKHARDDRGRFVYRTTREGRIVEGATSIYSDCFAVYGISEYYRATPDGRLMEAALEIFRSITRRVEEKDFRETAPYHLPPGRRAHGPFMIVTELANELAATTGDSHIARTADKYAELIMERFVLQDRRVLIEFLGSNFEELPPPEGTFVMPGHAIESMWFVMHTAKRRGDCGLIERAAEVLRWHLERGWDSEYGGIFLGIDSEGGTPHLPNAEKKVWWPHSEALYALLLAHVLTGESWCSEWYRRVHEWSFAHFPMPDGREWYQRLDRRGSPVQDVVALPVKDPFHLPRAVLLILQLLESAADAPTVPARGTSADQVV